MADAAQDEFEGERIEALVDVHRQAVVAPVAFGREVNDELWPPVRCRWLQFEDEHMTRSYAPLPARLLIKDVIGGVSLLKMHRKALTHHNNAVDGAHERFRLKLQKFA